MRSLLHGKGNSKVGQKCYAIISMMKSIINTFRPTNWEETFNNYNFVVIVILLEIFFSILWFYILQHCYLHIFHVIDHKCSWKWHGFQYINQVTFFLVPVPWSSLYWGLFCNKPLHTAVCWSNLENKSEVKVGKVRPLTHRKMWPHTSGSSAPENIVISLPGQI